MALLAEEIVEEWLNRQGYFTIRGIKVGVDEIDLLAIRPLKNKDMECRHFEVQCSMRPISYISRVPKEIQKKDGRTATSAKERSEDELMVGIDEWIVKKYTSKKKTDLMRSLCPSAWTRELVINAVKSKNEIRLMKNKGIEVHNLADIVSYLSKNDGVVKYASGANLTDLIMMGVRAKTS